MDSVDFWGTREATASQEIPRSLLVLGGGVSGAELAQAYARLGAAVTLVVRGDLLASYPEPARRLVEAGLREDGIDVRLHTTTQKAAQDDSGIHLTLTPTNNDGGAAPSIVSGTKLLVSTGRHPALTDLGFEDVGIVPRIWRPIPVARWPVWRAAGSMLSETPWEKRC